MSTIDVNTLVNEMRAMAAQARAEVPAVGQTDKDGPGFPDMLKQTIGEVNALQQRSANMAAAFEGGDPDIDIAEVMVAIQKASVSFQAVTQVRNRLVRAYQEVMNMPV